MKLADHPTVKEFHKRATAEPVPTKPSKVDADRLRRLCREAGADDVGLVEIGRPALDDQRSDILRFFPATQTLIHNWDDGPGACSTVGVEPTSWGRVKSDFR